ncbi:hypothetical protein FDG95_gp117 [Pectobacterium phage vB_PcaM_CBB]|uniref:Uncharacterized protein n=1 Tax=Pectobacterium phage vB_PcaM_CBB TaxID=2772511 RepID=A0A1L2CUI2_9CAUD|nr:hypothetical protein FDG95_gp117 [Pectobacterium phage vB_PcaM_CBB]AMM43682.1 hypothetical protein CBB_117 [Pectobacterium phage vB_PcaM_CBB]
MGSFNTSCAISQLPIGMGDEVKLFFIVAHPAVDRNHLFPNHYYDMVGLPLDVVYDDYGKYELVDNERNKSIWETHSRYFKEALVSVPAGKRSREEEVDPNNITFESIQEHIWEGRARVKYKFFDMPEQELALAVYPIHAELYNEFSKSYKYWNGEINLEEKLQALESHPHYPYYVDHVNFMANYDEDKLETVGEGEEEDLSEEAKIHLWVHSDITLYNALTEFRQIPIIYQDIGLHFNANSVMKTVNYELDEYMTFAREFISSHIFNCYLHKLNIQITPSLTSGQSYFYRDHIAFHEKIASIAKNKLTECEYRDD